MESKSTELRDLLSHSFEKLLLEARAATGDERRIEKDAAKRIGVLCRILGRIDEAASLLEHQGSEARAAALIAEASAMACDLGMTRVASQLARISGAAAEAVSDAPDIVLEKEGEYWTITSRTSSFRLRDCRGLQILARLIDEPGRDFHVTELASPSGAKDTGDAGEMIDRRARDAYRCRLHDLQDELREAESFGDIARAERAREELEFLAQELSRTIGISGDPRKASSASERARSAVGRRVRDAIKKIARHDPALGTHLAGAVHTGTYCSYKKG